MRSIPRLPRAGMLRQASGAVAGAILAVFAGCASPRVEVPVRAESVHPGEIRLTPDSPKLSFIGVDVVDVRHEKVVAALPAQVMMDEDHTVRILSPVVGRVTALGARAGDKVRHGDVLARITSSDLALAASDLVKAEASARQTAASLARAHDLYDHGVVALKELEQASVDDAQARAERDRASLRLHQLGGAGDHVEGDYLLRAPFTGTIVDRSVGPGAEVRNDNGQVLFTLSALDTVWIVVSAYPRDLPAISPGARLQFTTESAPGRSFTASVLRVSSALDPQTHTATVTAAMHNPDGVLRPQVYGEARVMAADPSGESVIASTALVTDGGGMVVFVQKSPGDFERRPVTVGQDDGVTAVIAQGLRPGERVVTRGSVLLSAEAH